MCTKNLDNLPWGNVEIIYEWQVWSAHPCFYLYSSLWNLLWNHLEETWEMKHMELPLTSTGQAQKQKRVPLVSTESLIIGIQNFIHSIQIAAKPFVHNNLENNSYSEFWKQVNIVKYLVYESFFSFYLIFPVALYTCNPCVLFLHLKAGTGGDFLFHFLFCLYLRTKIKLSASK